MTDLVRPVKTWPRSLVSTYILFFILFLLDTASLKAGCTTGKCHDTLTRANVIHVPVAEGECEICHVSTSDHHPNKKKTDFSLSDPVPQLCYQCHASFSAFKSIHAAVKNGDCLKCHDVHSSKKPGLLKYAIRPAELCYRCHDKSRFDGSKFKHGPSSGGYCLVCHDPHASQESPILKQPPKKLCFFCHTDFEARYRHSRYVHSPIEEESCTACHDPHGSQFEKFTKDTMPGLCVTCHEEIKGETVRARHKHKAVYMGKRCGNCHDIHFSKNKGLLHEDEMELCLSCHNKVDTKRSHPVRNIEKEIKGKKYVHGPLKQKRCIPCHNPHGSRYWRLLLGPYPSSFYANYRPGIYGFCWRCHDKKILTSSYKEAFTGFSNGKENLHVLHVKKKLKGRTCRACHAPHASNWPKLVTDTGAPFGEWKIPIRFKRTKTGGSCVPGCHREISYDRLHPVDYSVEEGSDFIVGGAR